MSAWVKSRQMAPGPKSDFVRCCPKADIDWWLSNVRATSPHSPRPLSCRSYADARHKNTDRCRILASLACFILSIRAPMHHRTAGGMPKNGDCGASYSPSARRSELTGRDDRPEGMAVLGAAIMQEIAAVPQRATSLHGHIPGDLPHPRYVRVNRDPGTHKSPFFLCFQIFDPRRAAPAHHQDRLPTCCRAR
jgi:hypothetical protein